MKYVSVKYHNVNGKRTKVNYKGKDKDLSTKQAEFVPEVTKSNLILYSYSQNPSVINERVIHREHSGSSSNNCPSRIRYLEGGASYDPMCASVVSIAKLMESVQQRATQTTSWHFQRKDDVEALSAS